MSATVAGTTSRPGIQATDALRTPAEALRTAYTASSRSRSRRFRPTASHTTLRDATQPDRRPRSELTASDPRYGDFIPRLPATVPLRNLPRWARTRAHRLATRSRLLRARALVLVYHRFTDLGPGDSQALAVKPERFAEQLEVLRGEYRVRPLRSLLNCEAGTTGAVAVTADDGYADNLHEMKPRLAQAGVPASVFVTTGYVGAGREYWWDELERTLLHPGRNRRFVELTLDRKHRSWPTATVYERAAAFGAIRAWLMKLGEEELGEALVQLRRSAGEPDAGAPRDTHRPMNVDELSELVADGLVEIGAHTHSHVNLAAQPLAVQRAEISRSKRSLETWLDRPVPTFAYPFGWRGAHYGRGTRDAVLAAGFEAAVTMHPWAIHSRVDRYQIPRYVVGDWDGHELERRLHDLLEPPSRAPRPAAAECSRRLRV